MSLSKRVRICESLSSDYNERLIFAFDHDLFIFLRLLSLAISAAALVSVFSLPVILLLRA